MPPFAAFFMKVLSLSLNDEPSPVTLVSAALTAPAMLIAPITKPRIHNCETTLILVFMVLFDLTRRGRAQRQIQIEGGRLVGRERITLRRSFATLLSQAQEIFRWYELSTRWAT